MITVLFSEDHLEDHCCSHLFKAAEVLSCPCHVLPLISQKLLPWSLQWSPVGHSWPPHEDWVVTKQCFSPMFVLRGSVWLTSKENTFPKAITVILPLIVSKMALGPCLQEEKETGGELPNSLWSLDSPSFPRPRLVSPESSVLFDQVVPRVSKCGCPLSWPHRGRQDWICSITSKHWLFLSKITELCVHTDTHTQTHRLPGLCSRTWITRTHKWTIWGDRSAENLVPWLRASEGALSGFVSQLLKAVWPWTKYSTLLLLGLLTCEKRTIIVCPSKPSWRR